MKRIKKNLIISVLCCLIVAMGSIPVCAEDGISVEESQGVNAQLARAGTITASDHWTLPVKSLSMSWANGDLYCGAEGYTVSSTYHRTSVEYLVSWESVKIVRKWGTGKVQASTGYVKPPYANLRSAFKSAVYYEF